MPWKNHDCQAGLTGEDKMAQEISARLTVLCENSVSGPFGIIGEHGWSVLVETGSRKLLFDTGQGQGLVSNATWLGRKLHDIDAVILSHGHYDHTGGLPQALQIAGQVPVYCHPDIFLDRWWIKGQTSREIGLRFKRSWLESIGADFVFVRRFTEIYPNIYLTGEVPRKTGFEPPDPHMKIRGEDGAMIQDPILDDMSMVVDTPGGLVVILGCAHAGIINILEHVVSMLPGKKIRAVMGGTHLGFADDRQFEETLSALERFEVGLLGASHCTGLENSARLHAHLGERFFFASAGHVLEV